MRRLFGALAIAGFLVASLAVPASARSTTFDQASTTFDQASTTFDRPTASATFGTEVVFRQAFESPVNLARVEILVEYPGSIGPLVTEVAGPTEMGRRELDYHRTEADDGHLAPNTRLTARWRLVPADRSLAPQVGPPVTILYADTRFAWKTLKGDLVRLHWYEGSDAFGRSALEIGERGVREAASFLGVTESEPIDFFVYADQAAFYDALGPGTRENVGGQAQADTRTMFALIGPGDVSNPWVGVVIPHELTHLVFDTAVRNPYNFPPRWLNEGVSMSLSEGYTTSDRSTVEAAARSGELIPLRALGGQFPTTRDRFYLAYAESISAVTFLVREKGEDALVRLVRSYADGVTDDEAFRAATGLDLAGFEEAWLADLGADPPQRFGPQAAPSGPVPVGWDSGPSASPGAPAGTSPVPAGSGDPGVAPEPGPDEPTSATLVLAVGAVAIVLIAGSLLLRRRRGDPRERPG